MNILNQIVEQKRREVECLRSQAARLQEARSHRSDFRDFAGALRNRPGTALIAEIKKASPSAGVIRSDFDAVRIATEYEAAGATALSVLTDETFFQGRIASLQEIR